MSESDTKQLYIRITGRVQAVFFRDTTKKVAGRMGLVGEIKNLENGSVELVAQGDESLLQKLLDWCYRGSFFAKVEGLTFEWQKPIKKYSDFTIIKSDTFFEDKAAAAKNLTKYVFQASGNLVPKHLVVIPDGNRRWAEEQGMNPWDGHKEALKTITTLSEHARKHGIKYVTFWGFSTENWKRDKKEIDMLMLLFEEGIKGLRKDAIKNNVRFHHFGRKDRLPKRITAILNDFEQETKNFDGYHIGLALDYGGRDELLRAVNACVDKKSEGAITEDQLSQLLDTKHFPDPDLIIRTSGEHRTSGMMLWQSAYAEFYFSPLYFPEFSAADLDIALQDFASRGRRFGGSSK